MLQRQVTQLILDSTNKTTDYQLSEIQELKISLKYSQSDIHDIKNNLVKYSEEEINLQEQVHELKSKLLWNDFESLDVLGWRPDDADEAWTETETKVGELFSSMFNLDSAT